MQAEFGGIKFPPLSKIELQSLFLTVSLHALREKETLTMRPRLCFNYV